jgi:hypothetical protein
LGYVHSLSRYNTNLMSTEITINQDQIDINVDTTVVTIEAPQGGYPLPNNVYSVFGRIGNVVAQEGDYTLTQLGGVTITNPLTGQALVYNGTSWVNNTETYVGTVTSVNMSVPTGLTISGNPITTAGTLALGLASGYSIPTTASQATWNTAYNDSIVSAAVTGVQTKTLTLNQQDGGTITASWSDYDTAPVTSVFGRTGAITAQSGDYNTLQVTENTNLYFTNQRARFAISGDATSGVVYSNTTGIIALDDIPNTSLFNDSVTINGKTVALGGSTTLTTTDIGEGTNLYFTTARAQAAISGTAPISVASGVVSISQANSTTNGYLSSADWNTFNAKQAALTLGNLTSSDITVTGGTGAVVGSGSTLTLATVNSNVGQFGSSTAIPKITVNGKGLITAISTEAVFIPSGALSFIGDVTGTGNTGSDTTLTLATVNSNVGAYGDSVTVPTITVNAKGLVTAASQTAIPTATSSVTGLLTSTDWSTFNAKQAQLNGTGFVKVSGTTVSYDNSTYLTTIEGIAAGGELSGTYASPSLVNSAVTGKVLTGVNITGGTIQATDSILTAFGKIQNQINGLIGGSIYQGTWNASTNTPTLTSGVGTKGYYYIVSVAGSTNLDGITDWNVGDWAIYDGTAWQQVDNTDAVVSVNGFTGAVSLTTSNISEGTNLYYTDSRARGSVSAGTGISYNSTTGVITNSAPDQTVSLTGAGTTSISGTYPNFTITSNDQYVGTVTSVGLTSTAAALSISNSPITTSGNIGVNFAGASGQYVAGDGSLVSFPSLTGYVPYTGATGAVNLGAYDLTVNGLTIGKGNSSLSNNTALGYQTLFHITTGNNNTAVGYQAGHNITTGTYNVSIGQSAMFTNTTGGLNTAIGVNALLLNTTGGSNVVIGLDGLQHNTTGSSNTAIGYNAGSHITGGSTPNTTASSSVYIGRDTKAKVDGGVNEIVIGYNAVGNGSNTVTFGNISTTSNHFTGSVNAGSFVKSGGTSSEFLKANGSVDSTSYQPLITAGTTAQYYRGDKTFQTLDTSVVPENTNLYYTDARARGAISLTTTGNNGASTYNSTTGVLNVPTYTLAGLGGINLTSLSATSPLLYNNTTGVFSIQQSSGSQAGFLSAADWTTFNSKQGAITLTTTGSSGAATFSAGTLNIPNYTLSGLGGVPTTRTLTINGTTQDLSADRSWTITPNVNATNTQDYTATAAQTTFTVTGGYTVGQLAVFYNGSKLASNEFTAINGTTFTLATACQANDIVQAVVAVTGGGIGGSGTTNYHSKWTASGLLGNSLIWDNGTNVGIGNTNTTYTLDVTGTGRFTGALTAGSTITATGSFISNVVNGYGLILNRAAVTNYNGISHATGGVLRWFVGMRENLSSNNYVIYNEATGADALTISTSNNNVGIGTTSPDNRLSVVGAGGISGIVRWSDGVTGTGFLGQTTDGITYVHSNNNALAFGANGNNNFAETMRITSGRVGIGMTAPADLLSVSSNAPTMSLRYTSAGTVGTPVQANFYFRDFNANGGTIRGGIYFQDLSQNTSGCNMLLRVMNNSDTIITSINMQRDGSVYNFNNSTTWQQTSDIKIKENIRPINDALGKICALNPTHFEYKNKLGKTKTGFIAQEFEQVFAGHVTESYPSEEYAEYFEDGEMMKSIDADLIPYLVKAIQELKAEVDTLKQLVK